MIIPVRCFTLNLVINGIIIVKRHQKKQDQESVLNVNSKTM